MTKRFTAERLRLSIRIDECAPSGLAGEPRACAGIDIQSSRGAPGDELLRVDGCADGDAALGAKLALDGLRLGLPLVERGGERLTVSHDLDDPSVIRASVPRDTDEDGGGGQSFEHGEFPTVFLAAAQRLGLSLTPEALAYLASDSRPAREAPAAQLEAA
jgi:hypothetical protein